MRNLHQLFVLCTASQIIGGDFTKFCGLLRIYELYITDLLLLVPLSFTTFSQFPVTEWGSVNKNKPHISVVFIRVTADVWLSKEV